MPTLQATKTFSGVIGGSCTITRTAAGGVTLEGSVAGGKAGSLTTRTDNDTGQVTAASHGLSNGDIVDVYWSGGSRYGMTVGVVAGDVVPVDGGAGDNLPAAATAVVIVEQTVWDADFVGDKVKGLAVVPTQRSTVLFYDGSTLRLAVRANAREPWDWMSDQNIANPLATYTISSVRVSHDQTAAAVIGVGVVYDATV